MKVTKKNDTVPFSLFSAKKIEEFYDCSLKNSVTIIIYWEIRKHKVLE